MSIFLFILFLFHITNANEESEEEIHFTNAWAVHIETDDIQSANDIAAKHGFVNQGQVN